MITVSYNRKAHSLSVNGHACSGEPGNDLICSAASILVYTFASAVVNAENAGHTADTVVELKSGRALVSCRPVARMEKLLRAMLDTVCAGFELLARNYPDNVKYERRG